MLPWRAGKTAIQTWPGASAALVAAAAVAWLAVAVLAPRPLLPDPGRALLGLWAVALALVALKLVSDRDGLAVGAWASGALAAVLVALASRRRGGVPATRTG